MRSTFHIGPGGPSPNAGSGVKPDRIPNGVAAGIAKGLAVRLRAASRPAVVAADTSAGSAQPVPTSEPGWSIDSIRSGTTAAPDSRPSARATAGDALTTKAFTGAMVSATRVPALASESAELNAALFGAITM